MNPKTIDRLIARIAAITLASWAIFGWDWSASYREKPVDEWELPMLSILLVIAALVPARIVVKATMRPIVALLAIIDVAIFVWWLFERAVMEYGGFDVGGIALRTIAYGLVLYLFFPTKNLRAQRHSDEGGA
jgi:hypothetical protein